MPLTPDLKISDVTTSLDQNFLMLQFFSTQDVFISNKITSQNKNKEKDILYYHPGIWLHKKKW